MTKAQQLSKKFGGKWEYDGFGTWYRDDGIAHVTRCSSAHSDDNATYTTVYWLYEVWKKPIRVYFT